MNYVIIGNSAAGIGAVEGIRRFDKSGTIIIVSDEPHHTYSRPLISYLLEGKTTIEKMLYRNKDFYKSSNVTLLSGMHAEEINKDAKQVKLTSGKIISYDKLLIATGSSPFVPPIEGLESVKNKTCFMTLNDASYLDKTITKQSRVLILGAGLIGLKCAEGIYKKAGEITICDLSSKVLSSILDDVSSQIVKRHIESKGIKFYLGESVQKFSESTAFLSGGQTLVFDILVTATGVRPNCSLIKKIAQQAVNRGIITDEGQQTSIKDIYAAGDCTQSKDITSGENKMLALLPNAYMQGECAGVNMAGGFQRYVKAMPMNSIGFFGKRIITAGTYTGDVYLSQTKGYKKLFFKDNILKGFILVDCPDKAGIYTSLIREKTPLDTIDFELICENPGLIAFSKQKRADILGGAV